MTDPHLRHIAIVLDRSGSMQTIKADTEGGLAAFLAAQREAPGTTTVSLYQFDHACETVYEYLSLDTIPVFALQPRGRTALLDAIGETITALGADLASHAEAERPGEVIVVILTDGQENASRKYTQEAIKALITQQQDIYSWKFVFLGADQDAFAAAGEIGISREMTLSYSGSRTRESLTAAGQMVLRGSRTGTHAFTGTERHETS
jgi:uncharacterized protein YegL